MSERGKKEKWPQGLYELQAGLSVHQNEAIQLVASDPDSSYLMNSKVKDEQDAVKPRVSYVLQKVNKVARLWLGLQACCGKNE